MAAALAERAPVEDQDVVHVLDGRQPVCDGDGRPSLHQDVQGVADHQFRLGIHARRRLVQNQDTWVEGQRTGERQQLLLPDRQRRAPLGDRAVVSERQSFDERARMHRCGGPPDLIVGDGGAAEANVARDRAREQMHILQDEAEDRSQVLQPHLPDIDAIHQNAALADIVEPQQEVDQRGLPRARRADDPNALARTDLERHVSQDVVFP